VTSTNTVITDYIPCGLAYSSDFGNNTSEGWILGADGNLTYTSNQTLLPSESYTKTVWLQIHPCDESDAFVNVAEVITDDGEDVDSEPATFLSGQDDEAEVGVGVFDLALMKTVDEIGPYLPGEIVEFNITVYNQGHVDAYDIEITDYLNAGYLYQPSWTTGESNTGWVVSDTDVRYTIAGPLSPGMSQDVILYLEVQVADNATRSDWYNEAEINFATSTAGSGINTVDSDSFADSDSNNDNDVQDGGDLDFILFGDNNDNVINENFNDPFGLGDDDEDDNDAAEILVTSELGDTVWKDVDGNGIQDPGEVGLEGVRVILTRCDGEPIDPWVTDTLYTDVNGMYIFDQLLPSIINGGYMVEFDISELPAGCAFTLQNQGNDATDSDVDIDGISECIFLDPGENNYSVDAGLLVLAKVGNYVWNDCNGNGIQDAGEAPLANIRVELYNESEELVQYTFTNVNGEYVFESIYPGEYYLRFYTPNGSEPSIPGTGVNSTLDSDINGSNGEGTTSYITLSSGECDFDSGDAGYYECIPLGELVWYDNNGNDIKDPTENGVNGIKVEVYRDSDGVWELYDFQFTGHKPGTPSDDGYWKMCVPPGDYYIKYIAPSIGLSLVNADRGNSDLLDSDVTNGNGPGTTDVITLTCGDDRCDIGSGYEPMSTFGDRVWDDSNGNGLIDSEENGIRGVEVIVYNDNREFVDQTVTDFDGYYKLNYLQERDYYVEFIPPSGYVPTIGNMGDESMDSDIDFSNGLNTTALFRTESGQHLAHIDAGFVRGVILSNLYLGVSVERIDEANQVDWSVASDPDVDFYGIEVMKDGNFKEIGQIISGKNTENYTYYLRDNNASSAGQYLYRVVAYLASGETQVSEIVSITVDPILNSSDVSVYPNPASEIE